MGFCVFWWWDCSVNPLDRIVLNMTIIKKVGDCYNHVLMIIILNSLVIFYKCCKIMMELVRELDICMLPFHFYWFVYWDDLGEELIHAMGTYQDGKCSYVRGDMSV